MPAHTHILTYTSTRLRMRACAFYDFAVRVFNPVVVYERKNAGIPYKIEVL